MNQTQIVFAGLAALYLAGCAPTGNHEADIQSLKDNEARWNQEYATKDLEKILAHYASDGVIMAPGMPPAAGPNAIRKLLSGMVADPALSLQFQAASTEVSKSGDVGYTHGSYRMAMTDPGTKKVINDHGSYVTTYRREADGGWRAVADIATSEVPMPASLPASGASQ